MFDLTVTVNPLAVPRSVVTVTTAVEFEGVVFEAEVLYDLGRDPVHEDTRGALVQILVQDLLAELDHLRGVLKQAEAKS